MKHLKKFNESWLHPTAPWRKPNPEKDFDEDMNDLINDIMKDFDINRLGKNNKPFRGVYGFEYKMSDGRSIWVSKHDGLGPLNPYYLEIDGDLMVNIPRNLIRKLYLYLQEKYKEKQLLANKSKFYNTSKYNL